MADTGYTNKGDWGSLQNSMGIDFLVRGLPVVEFEAGQDVTQPPPEGLYEDVEEALGSGFLAPDDSRIILPSQASPRNSSWGLTDAIRSAFELRDVVRMSRSGHTRADQIALARLVAMAVMGDDRMTRLIQTMSERLGSHYFHGARVSIMYLDLVRNFLRPGRVPVRSLSAVGIMHDCGKLEVSEQVLFKNATLTLEETVIMRRHSRAAYYMLLPMQDRFPYIAEVAIFHHPYPRTGVERRNGRSRRWADFPVSLDRRLGMGRRLFERRELVPDVERAGHLLRVADTYDALASTRGYKEAYPASKVRKMMLEFFPGSFPLVDFLLAFYPPPAG